jgi:hypothetical protein
MLPEISGKRTWMRTKQESERGASSSARCIGIESPFQWSWDAEDEIGSTLHDIYHILRISASRNEFDGSGARKFDGG